MARAVPIDRCSLRAALQGLTVPRLDRPG